MKYKEKIKRISDFAYNYRYVWVVILFVLCVLFEFSGSSIGAWNVYLGNMEEVNMEKDLLGKSREIRTDEWTVNTPMAFSQYFNRDGALPYF